MQTILKINGIPVAAGLLYAFGGPLLNPILAAAAMSLSSVSVLANATILSDYHAANGASSVAPGSRRADHQ